MKKLSPATTLRVVKIAALFLALGIIGKMLLPLAENMDKANESLKTSISVKAKTFN